MFPLPCWPDTKNLVEDSRSSRKWPRSLNDCVEQSPYCSSWHLKVKRRKEILQLTTKKWRLFLDKFSVPRLTQEICRKLGFEPMFFLILMPLLMTTTLCHKQMIINLFKTSTYYFQKMMPMIFSVLLLNRKTKVYNYQYIFLTMKICKLIQIYP